MNRNVLKIIALVSMLIDHVGEYIFNNNIALRIIGRIAFPIFAFFIAEGMKYTKNRKRYVLTILVCACISQFPYMLLEKRFILNALFTFLIAILLIVLIESLLNKKTMQSPTKILLLIFSIAAILTGYFVLDWCGFIDYSIFGALLVVVFYFFKNALKYVFAIVVILLMTFKNVFIMGFSLGSMYQIFAVLALVLLLFYNNDKGRLKLKYLFYGFYPLHLLVIWLITIII